MFVINDRLVDYNVVYLEKPLAFPINFVFSLTKHFCL